MGVEYMSPDGLHKNPAFSQVVVARGQVRILYVGGQASVDSSGNVVGKGDIGRQAEQAFENWRFRFPLRELDWTLKLGEAGQTGHVTESNG